jgi:hypothetical protein
MSAARLITLARARRLDATRALVERFPHPQLFDTTPVPVDARLDEPPHTLPKRVLGQMARRGLDPALVRTIWTWLDGRPLERALVAVDVLARSLLLPGDPLLAELRAAATTLGELRPPPRVVGLDLNASPAAALIARFARDPALRARAGADLLALSYDFHLGALDELERRDDPLLRSRETLESVRAFGRLLHLAHLPTLASLYLDWLSRPLGHRPAALDLCEALFDAGEPSKIPGDAIRPGDVPAADASDMAEYLVYRIHTALDELQVGWTVCEQNFLQRDPALGPLRDRLAVARAHLGTLARARPVPLAAVTAACERDRGWRYGAGVHAIVAAAQLPPGSPQPLQLAHDYVTGFGNDAAFWRDLVTVVPPSAPLRADAVRVLAREAAALPHEPATWRALALLVAGARDARAPLAEIDARLDAQTLGAP